MSTFGFCESQFSSRKPYKTTDVTRLAIRKNWEEIGTRADSTSGFRAFLSPQGAMLVCHVGSTELFRFIGGTQGSWWIRLVGVDAALLEQYFMDPDPTHCSVGRRGESGYSQMAGNEYFLSSFFAGKERYPSSSSWGAHQNKLTVKNRHLRDSLLQFCEGTHAFLVNGVTLSSVTSICSELLPFNKEEAAEAVVRKHSCDPSSPYFKCTVDMVLQKWDAARLRGIQFHENIEHILDALATGIYYPLDGFREPDAPAIRQHTMVKEFLEKHKGRAEEHLIGVILCDLLHTDHKFDHLYRLEWAIFSEELGFCGRIDAVFYTPKHLRIECPRWLPWATQHVTVVDWKHIGSPSSWESSKKRRYLQLLLYKLILEISYNMVVDCMISAGAGDDGDTRFEFVGSESDDSVVFEEVVALLRDQVHPRYHIWWLLRDQVHPRLV